MAVLIPRPEVMEMVANYLRGLADRKVETPRFNHLNFDQRRAFREAADTIDELAKRIRTATPKGELDTLE